MKICSICKSFYRFEPQFLITVAFPLKPITKVHSLRTSNKFIYKSPHKTNLNIYEIMNFHSTLIHLICQLDFSYADVETKELGLN